jgi:hypothetical protein
VPVVSKAVITVFLDSWWPIVPRCRIDVIDTHSVCSLAVAPIRDCWQYSLSPKSNPRNVSDADPVAGWFILASLVALLKMRSRPGTGTTKYLEGSIAPSNGSSKINACVKLLTTLPKVNKTLVVAPPRTSAMRQTSEEEDCHRVISQCVDPTRRIGENIREKLLPTAKICA